MAVYRIYLVHPDGALEPGDAYYSRTDAEAVERFQPKLVEDTRAELWQGGRFVAVKVARRQAEAFLGHHANDA